MMTADIEQLIKKELSDNSGDKNRNIADIMVKSLEKSGAAEVLEINDKMRVLETDLMKLQKELDALKQKGSLLQKSYSTLVDRCNVAADDIKNRFHSGEMA